GVGANVVPAGREAARGQAVGQDVRVDLVAQGDARRDVAEADRLVEVGRYGDHGVEVGVQVGPVQHHRTLVLVGVAGAEVQAPLVGQVDGPVAVEGDALGIDGAAGVSEGGVDEVVQHLTAGVAVELVEADHAAGADVAIVVQLDLVAHLLLAVEGQQVGDAVGQHVEVDVGLGIRLALGDDVLQGEVIVDAPVDGGRG